MEPTTRSSDAIVIGGGVIGLACALELAGRGLEVRVLERERVGAGASERNCGLVTPSHALPLNRPGRVRQVLLSLLRPAAPVRVRPGAALGLLGWARRFEESSRPGAVAHAARARAALLLSSRALLEVWRARGDLEGCEWAARGLLVACASEEALAEEVEVARGPLAALGVEAQALSGAELTRLEPALREGLAGGVLFPQDAHLRPEALLERLAARLRERGVRIEEGCEVQELRVAGGGVQGLRTTSGEQRAGTYVLAAGVWSPRLARRLDLRLPIVPGKGYSQTHAPRPDAPAIPMVLQERSMAVTPWPSGLRLGGTMEFAGLDASLRKRRLDALVHGARRYLRTELDEGQPLAWAGWRPMTPDEMPILGRAPQQANLLVAAGHGMLGVCTAPASARLIAELVTGAAPHLDPSPYLPERFA